MKRIIANLLALCGVMFLPWFLAVILLLVLLFIFDFIEIIVYGFILDLVYGISPGFFIKNIFLISAVISYVLVTTIKPSLRGS